MGKKEVLDKTAEATSQDPVACKVEGGLRHYWELKNMKSLDGLTGLTSAPASSFSLTGYGVPGTLQQTGKVATEFRSAFADLGDLKLLIGFILGALATSLCFKALII